MPQPDPMPSGFEATLLQVHRQQRMALESYQLLTKQHEVWQRSVEQLLTKAHEVPRSPLLVAPPPCSLFTAEPFQLPEAETPPDSMPLSQMSPTGADRAESNRLALALSKSTVERFQGPDKKGGPLKKIVAELREEQEARERKKEEKGFWRKLQRNVSELVLSRWFEYVTGLVILLNMVTIGIEAELSAHGTSESWAVDAERVFLALYTIEITLRIIGLGTKNLTILWFYLDFFLVAIGLLARVVVPVFGLGDLAGFEKLLLVRCLRLLRLVRALRMISHFKVMWRLVYSLLTAGQTLLSTAVLTLLALFIFGCVALEFITKDLALKEHPETGPIVQDYFDTLPMAILTLTQFVTLDSVAQIYYPLIVMPVSRPRSMEDWLYVLPDCVTSESWAVTISQPKAQLLHRPCPWGGHLVKFDLKGIEIADAPENTANLIVRPEVRAAMSGWCAPGISGFQGSHTTIRSSEFVAPGEAIIESKTSSWLMHLCAVLFGEMSGKKLSHFFHDPQVPVVLHQKIRRNYPSEGDSAVAIWEEGGEVQEGFLLIRPDREKGKFNVMFVMRILQGKFAPWATFQFRLLMEGVHRSTQFFLNRPNIRELREVSEKFYVTLSIQSFKRGLPMVPCSSKPTVTIDAGERFCLKLWRCYKTERRGAAGSKGKFFLSEYLTILVNALGEELQTPYTAR